MCLQEIWKLQKDLKVLDDIHNMYLSVGVSGVDANRSIIHGQLYGGVEILYHKHFTFSQAL